MSDETDAIDSLVGGAKSKTSPDGHIPVKQMGLERIKPNGKQNLQGGHQASVISADPQNDTVGIIIDLINAGDDEGARRVASESEAPEFLGAFVDEVLANGGQDADRWMFIRRIHAGAKGKNSPVTVELGYKADGDVDIVSVPKDMIYRVDMRSWKNSDMLPKPSTSTGGDSIVSDSNPAPLPADNNPVADSASTPGNASGDAVPPTDDNNELAELIGGQAVAGLKQLGLLDGVQIADTSITDFRVIEGIKPPNIKIIGSNGEEMEVGTIQPRSSFGPSGQKGDFIPYSPENMGEVIWRNIQGMIAAEDNRGGKELMVEQLKMIRKHMDSLSGVFGFDDPRQLEAFFCAWLMEDSTCRLSGIPGTGKTTVINSAASLLANSYGFTEMPRYRAKRSNPQAGTPNEVFIFPAGQKYSVQYGDKKFQETLRAWEDWRFTDWKRNSQFSGSYLYDFKFLQRKSDSGYAKHPMSPEDFARLLLAESSGNTLTATAIPYPTLEALFNSHNANVPDSVTNKDGFAQDRGTTFYTDAGANEGYAFREFLLEHFYDIRLGDKESGVPSRIDLICAEMLNECGIAKIDYDKRAEEILYGVEIRQITEDDPLSERSVASYQFDPTPRPIVTQPVKFFNEANRSGSGVEDAILGLIAERTVEYRGQTFNSPKFVAWMDTNPHQKGNDLAFVDRIDMELLFGTLSLGGRMKALTERYSPQSKGSRPEYQLIQRMKYNSSDERFIAPMRFEDLANVWKTINGLDFNASGSDKEEGGALLDISLLSVLFTQRWMMQANEVEFYGGTHKFKDSDDIFSSPLTDISTTTNSQFESQHADWWKRFGSPDQTEGTQAPVLITRMLGFRFSNSLIKMTRAMAFLRGKDYVTRQEVIDALPYCVGHRLGPAREGEDPKGRDIGILREGMVVANEQDFIREIIMNGYVLQNTPSLMGGSDASNNSLMDTWDSFYKMAKNYMDSTNGYWKYESDVVKPLKSSIRNASSAITPVHWSIATMVVESVKSSPAYRERYKSYQERLQRPASKEGTRRTDKEEQIRQLMADVSASQYMKIRGEIAGNPYLFSDDRANLLSLADSKITSICGNVLKVTSNTAATSKYNSNYMAVPTDKPDAEWMVNPKSTIGNFTAFSNSIGGPNATKSLWRCYGDGMGAWGRIVSQAKNQSTGGLINLGANNEDYLKFSGDYDSNQNIGFTHQFRIPQQGDVVEDGTFIATMNNLLMSALSNRILEGGVVIGPKTSGYGVLETISDIQQYQEKASVLLGQWLSRPSGAPMSEVNATLKQGYNACFRLNHALGGVGESMKTLVNGKMVDIEGQDELRLWLSMRCIQGKNDTGTQATIGFYVGITSACMRPTRNATGDLILDKDNNPVAWEVLPMDSDDTYNPANYVSADEMYQDIGNMTIQDFKVITQACMEAIAEIGN